MGVVEGGEMNKDEREHRTIAHVISTLSVVCAARPEIIMDLLTGYLFDDEEAGNIKQYIQEEL